MLYKHLLVTTRVHYLCFIIIIILINLKHIEVCVSHLYLFFIIFLFVHFSRSGIRLKILKRVRNKKRQPFTFHLLTAPPLFQQSVLRPHAELRMPAPVAQVLQLSLQDGGNIKDPNFNWEIVLDALGLSECKRLRLRAVFCQCM